MTTDPAVLLKIDEAATSLKKLATIANLSVEIDARLRTVTRLRKKADEEEARVDALRKERQQIILTR